MSIFGRKATLGWKGAKYDLVVTMELVDVLDESINILQTAVELDKGGIPKMSLVAKVYATMLQHCGCEVTTEEVYESIMANPLESTDLVIATKSALMLFFPDQIDSPERATKSRTVKKK